MKKTVAILAPTGMLGSMVYNVLKEKHNLILVYRDKKKLHTLEKVYGGVKAHKTIHCDFGDLYHDYIIGFPKDTISPLLQKILTDIGKVDAVINCIGITKPHSLKNPEITLFINGAIPHIFAKHFGSKFIHITTDCVYDGIAGAPYDEDSPKNPNDLYGLSKTLGEPVECLTLRTSIIGPELEGSELLINWLKEQKGKEVFGFTNHFWNGITTKEFAKICDKIISNRKAYPKSGLFHVHSTDVSKYEMLKKIAEKYEIDVTITPKKVTPVDRRLATKFDLLKKLQVPSFEKMIQEL